MPISDNLKKLMDERQENPNSLAMKSGVPQPTIFRILSGESKEPRRNTVEKLARALAVSVDWIYGGVPRVLAASEPPSNGYAVTTQSVDVALMNATGSMGLGALQPEQETIIDVLHLSPRWVRANLPGITSTSNLAALTALGQSMEPTFRDGDILIVDRGVTAIKLDAIYVLARDGELYIKRVNRRFTDGALIIKSDNPNYDSVIVENGEKENVQVLGRVVWAWNGRKL